MNGRNSTVPSSRDLERARIEDEDRDEGEREPADLRPELADRLGGPELEELRVPPEAAVWPEPHLGTRGLGSGLGRRVGGRAGGRSGLGRRRLRHLAETPYG